MFLFSEYIIGSNDEHLLTSCDNNFNKKCNFMTNVMACLKCPIEFSVYELKLNNTAPSFTDTAIPDTIVCPIRDPCGVPFIVTGPPGQM